MQVLGMTRKNVFGLLFAIFCVSGNISCNKYLLSEKDKEEEKENIFIESFEGVSNIDLSNRNNWILTMNYYYIYDYTIDGKRIKSFPKDEPCYIPGSFITEDNSGSPWVGLGSGPLILFASPGYYSEFISGSTDNAPPTFFDQTTEEKLLAADCLSCQYTGKASTVLSDMLIHYNALLDFELKNVPESASVLVENQVLIHPFRDKANLQHYKAIVFAYWGEDNSQVHIAIDDRTYVVKLIPTINLSDDDNGMFLGALRHVKNDTYYKFSLSYDKEKDTFSIEDIENKVWSQIPD